MFHQSGELSLVECRHSLAGSLAVGLRGHNPRLVAHQLPRDARWTGCGHLGISTQRAAASKVSAGVELNAIAAPAA